MFHVYPWSVLAFIVQAVSDTHTTRHDCTVRHGKRRTYVTKAMSIRVKKKPKADISIYLLINF